MNENYTRFIKNLYSYKRAFTRDCHKNLWENYVQDYLNFDIPEFEEYVKSTGTDTSRLMFMWDRLEEFCKANGFENICINNQYSRRSPSQCYPNLRNRYHSGFVYYQMFVENIKSHLENKETFKYSWRGSYDVSIHGALGHDGIYRATMSLEYRNRGNGHYYMLINSNSAVFLEDD